MGCLKEKGAVEKEQRGRRDEAARVIKVERLPTGLKDDNDDGNNAPVPPDNSISNPHCSSSMLACVTLEKSKSSPVARLKISKTSMQVVSKWVVASYDLEIKI